jgi:hypothetical protein
MYTEPVNHSSGPGLVSTPFLVICMAPSLVGWAGSFGGVY